MAEMETQFTVPASVMAVVVGVRMAERRKLRSPDDGFDTDLFPIRDEKYYTQRQQKRYA